MESLSNHTFINPILVFWRRIELSGLFKPEVGKFVIKKMPSINGSPDQENATPEGLSSHLEALLGEHVITATTDTTGTIIHVNAKFSEVSGYSKEELIGQNHRILNSGHHPTSFFREMYKTIAAGKIWRGEIKNRAKDGSFYWVETTISSIKDGNGKIIRYISIHTVCTDRKGSEQALKENLNILNTTFNNFPGGISVITRDLKLQFANPAFYKLLGFPEDRFPIGTDYADFIRYNAEQGEYGEGDVETQVNNRVEQALKFKAHSFIRTLPNGRHLEVKGYPIPEGGFITTYTDVTEVDNLIAEVSEQNQRFNAALDNMSQGLCMFDSKQRLIVANKHYAEMYGLSFDLMKTGTTLRQILEFRIANGLYAGANPEAYIKERLEWVSSGVRSTKTQMLSDGRSIKISHMPMPDRGWLTLHEDVSERKIAEETTQRLAKIVDRSINEILVFDADTLKILQVNASACKNLGYTAEEFLELTPVDLKPEFSIEQFRKLLKPLRRSEKDHIRFAAVHRRKDGSLYDADVVLQKIDSEGRSVFAAIVNDITIRNKAESILTAHRDRLQDMVDNATRELRDKAEELTEALSKEKELNQLQRQFVSMASHEFRTPLTIIDNAAQLLKRKADSMTREDVIKRSDRIRTAVKRMMQLMESTLSAARMQDGKVAVKIRSCDIGEVVGKVCKRQQEISRDHIILCNLIDLPETIQADANAIEQVMANLLCNAVKYAPAAPEIEVVAHRQENDVVISIKDHGIGIDKSDLDRIGERFFRAKTSTGIAGTGIGLNLAKMLLEMHDGSIDVDSEKGKGSTFTVRLPVSGPQKLPQSDIRVACRPI